MFYHRISLHSLLEVILLDKPGRLVMGPVKTVINNSWIYLVPRLTFAVQRSITLGNCSHSDIRRGIYVESIN